MFDFLKKKISGFIDGLSGKEEAKAESAEARPVPEPEIETKPEPETEAKQEPEIEKPEPAPAIQKTETGPGPKIEIKKAPEAKPAPAIEKEKPKPEPKTETKPAPEKKQKPRVEKEKPKPQPEIKTETMREPEIEKPKPEPKTETKPKIALESKPVQRPVAATQKPETVKEKPKPAPEVSLPQFHEEKERGKKSQVSLNPLKAIKSFVTREVEISEEDVKSLLENFELELLESDVELGVAESIRQELQEKLVGAKVEKGRLGAFVKDAMRSTLLDTMSVGEQFDILERVRAGEKPVKIVFLGINGAGKTTTIAKVAHMLMQNNCKVVFAAADTFRAAAIEQMEVHATKLDVRLIKREYGSDPTSVAYDAMNYAKAHGIDAVLIDTAGRQDTNVNLINELKKMDRVIKPELKIYIGESIAGSSIIGQVSSFNREIGVDGVILTKLDCDPKGGSVLSVSKATGIPIICIGTGQKYEDLERFDAQKMAQRILS